ncbi:hypothetical protein GCM10020295_83530 [Streptomyces cinereospinus]
MLSTAPHDGALTVQQGDVRGVGAELVGQLRRRPGQGLSGKGDETLGECGVLRGRRGTWTVGDAGHARQYSGVEEHRNENRR